MPTYTVWTTLYEAVEDNPTEPSTYDIWYERDGVERVDLAMPTADVQPGDVIDGWTVVAVEENVHVRPEAIAPAFRTKDVVVATDADHAGTVAFDVFRSMRRDFPQVRFMDYVVEGPGGYRNDIVAL